MYLGLLLCCFVLSPVLLFYNKMKKSIFITLECVFCLLIFWHLLRYGFRVVLIPTYGVAILTLIFSQWRRVKGELRFSGKNRWIKKTVVLTGYFVFVMVSIGLVYLFPNFELPKPEGPYAIGSISLQLEDDSREELYTTVKGDHRKLMVEVWYPAETNVQEQTSTYPMEVAGALNSVLHVPDWLFGYFSKIDTHITPNADIKIADGKYPVVIFSPGNQSTRFQNLAVVETLVSTGYIVVGIDHPYTSNDITYLDGTVAYRNEGHLTLENNANLYETEVSIRADDVAFVLKTLRQNPFSNNEFKVIETGDYDTVGMFGHSYGGATITEAMSRDKSIKAGISYDGGLWGLATKKGLEQPFLYLSATKTLDYMTNDAPEASETRDFVTEVFGNIELAQDQSGDSFYFVSLDDYNHYSFTDISLISPLFQSGEETLQTTVKLTRTFLDTYLKNGNDGALNEFVNQNSNTHLILDISTIAPK